MGQTPRLLYLDRQSAFTSKQFLSILQSRGVGYKFVPLERHETFNGLAERHGGILHPMARSSLEDAKLTARFWIYYSVLYAVFVKNSVPHQKFNNSLTPYEKLTGKRPIRHLLKVFGCLVYVSIPLQKKKDNLDPITLPAFFWGIMPMRASEQVFFIM